MAAAFAQGTGIASSGSVASVSKKFVSDATAGNAIAVGAVASAATLTSGCIADDNTNTYNVVVIQNGVSAGCGESGGWWAKNVHSGPTTITCTPSSSDFCGIVIAEFSGIETSSSPIDGHGEVTVNPGLTFYNTASWTTTKPGVIFGVMEQNEGDTALAADGGSTQIFENENSVGQMPINGEYKLDPTPGGSKIGSWSLGSSRKGTAIGFSLAEPTGASVPVLASHYYRRRRLGMAF